MTWNYFRYIWLEKVWWYMSGMFLWDEMYSYWWLNIKKRDALYDDMLPCDRKYCRSCGKGKKIK